MTISPIFTDHEAVELDRIRIEAGAERAREIAGEAAKRAGLTLARVIGRDQDARAVRVRDIAIRAAARRGISVRDIAKAFGRDRSTIITALAREHAREAKIKAHQQKQETDNA